MHLRKRLFSLMLALTTVFQSVAPTAVFADTVSSSVSYEFKVEQKGNGSVNVKYDDQDITAESGEEMELVLEEGTELQITLKATEGTITKAELNKEPVEKFESGVDEFYFEFIPDEDTTLNVEYTAAEKKEESKEEKKESAEASSAADVTLEPEAKESSEDSNVELVPEVKPEEKETAEKEAVEVSEADTDEVKEKSDIEAFLEANVDSRYAEYKKAEAANIVIVKQTLADGRYMDAGDGISDVVENAGKGAFISMMQDAVYAYNVNDDSDYLVAMVDTMKNDDSYVGDIIVARYNTRGEVIDGTYYDYGTGLVYIPKSEFVDDNGEPVLASIQVQLLQVFNTSNPRSNVDVIVKNKDTGEERALTYTMDSTDVGTTIVVSDLIGVSGDDIEIKINGEPVDRNTTYFDSTTGELLIGTAPTGLETVEITIDEPSWWQKLFVNTIYANGQDIPVEWCNVIPTAKILVSGGEPTPTGAMGTNMTGYYTNDRGWVYSITQGAMPATEYSDEGTVIGYWTGSHQADGIVGPMAQAIHGNTGLDANHLYQVMNGDYPVAINITGFIGESNGIKYYGKDGYNNWLALHCAHVDSPNTGGFNDEGTAYIETRIFKVNTEEHWMLVGFLTPLKYTQTSAALYKIEYELDEGDLAVQKQSANRALDTSFGKEVELTDGQYSILTNSAQYEYASSAALDQLTLEDDPEMFTVKKASDGWYTIESDKGILNVSDHESSKYPGEHSITFDGDGKSDSSLWKFYDVGDNMVTIVSKNGYGLNNSGREFAYLRGSNAVGTAEDFANPEYLDTKNHDTCTWALVDADGNNALDALECYSLMGAEYGVYRDEACTDLIETLVTGANGYTNKSQKLKAGTYYVKETKAPTGYGLSSDVQSVNVGGGTVSVTVKNAPQSDPAAMLVDKQDAVTRKGVKGAEFTIKYYKGLYSKTSELKDVEPERTWVFATDKDGFAYVGDEWLVKGDDLYYMSTGDTAIPLGTITIKETKAPNGYIADSKTYIQQITADGSGAEMINTLNPTTIIEVPTLVYKTDINGGLVTGAKMQVLDADGKVIDEWTSAAEAHPLTNVKIGSEYTLHEVEAPAGYVLAKDVKFTVTAEGIDKSEMVDKRVHFTKENVGGEEVEGAKMTVLDSKGNVVDSWTSEKGGHYISGLEEGKIYTLHEEAAPDGYVVATDAEFTVTDDKADQEVKLTDKRIEFTKKSVGGEEVEGAKIQVKDESGKVVDEWTSTKDVHYINGLEEGKTYTLHEDVAADGFVKATDVQFTVSNDKITQKVELIDKVVRFSKVDVGGTEVEGAKIQVKDKSGKIVDSWTSTKDVHYINGLVEGETYTLHEEVAPEGFVKATDIQFTVTKKKEDQDVKLIDTILTVSKVDAGGTEIAGAKMQVVDKDGKVIDEWTSDGKEHKVNGLTAGETYTLKEDIAAEGYVIANAFDFTVTTEGVDSHVQMIDKRVFFTKLDIGGKEVEGAKIQVLDKSGKVVDEWTSTKEQHAIKGLEEGKTYTLHEEAAPDGYVVATDIDFTVTEDSKIEKFDQHVSLTDGQLLVYKKSAGGEEVEGAKIQVKDKKGNVVDEWTSTKEPHAVKGLKAGETYIMHEEICPNGYVVANDFEIKVNADGTTQTVIMTDQAVFIEKKDEDKKMQAGAVLEVYAADKDGKRTGKALDSWTTGTGSFVTVDGHVYHPVSGLEPGKTYVLHEAKAAKGYTVAKDVTFTVPAQEAPKADKSGNYTQAGQNISVEMINKKVEFYKKSAGGEEIPGAKIQVKDENGNIVDEWISTKEPHPIENLEVGKTYTLHEEVHPDGYNIANDFEFTVNDDFTVQTVEMIDTVSLVAKKDQLDQYVDGAVLQVLDADKRVVDSWVTGVQVVDLTDEQTKTLVETGELHLEGKYQNDEVTISETKTTTQKTKTIDEINAEAGKLILPGEVKLVEPSTGTMTIVKKDGEDGVNGYLMTVVDGDKTYYFDINEKGKSIGHRCNGMKAGNAYTLMEYAAPTNYLKASDMTLNPSETEDTVDTMKDTKTGTVGITKYDATNQKELPGARLKVTDKDGKVIDEWTSTREQHVIDNLVVGETYTLTETIAPESYNVAQSIKFTVADYASGQKVVQKVKMFDTRITKNVRTGIGPNMWIAAAALAAVCGVIYVIKKRREAAE